jgi:iron complex outermembrane receptor protein
LRYTHDEVVDAYSWFSGNLTLPPTLTTSRVTPRGVIRYQLDDSSSVYASASKGYKAAIYNVGAPTGQTIPILPESLWAYEVGYKHAAHNLTFNLAGYYYHYTDEQLAQYRIVNGIPQSSITNAATSKLYGIDADVAYRITDNFDVNVGLEWSHARYTNFPFAPDFTINAAHQLVNTTVNASGVQMTRAPDFTATVGATYKTEVAKGELVLSGNMYYTSKFYFDLAGHVPQKSYATLDLRAAWTDSSDRYTVALSGKNVTNTHYYIQVGQNALGIGAVYGAPPTVEGSLRLKF